LYWNCSLILKFHVLIREATNKISTKNLKSKSVYKECLVRVCGQDELSKEFEKLFSDPSQQYKSMYVEARARKQTDIYNRGTSTISFLRIPQRFREPNRTYSCPKTNPAMGFPLVFRELVPGTHRNRCCSCSFSLFT